MVRLRKLGSEFHHPDDFGTGTVMNMQYLSDFGAFQEYQDGDISRLFERQKGNEYAQNLTGARYYEKSGPGGYWQLNMFRAYTRYLMASVFDRSPQALDDSPAVQEQWKVDSPPMIRQARRAAEWFASKGRGVLIVENRYPGTPVPLAVDPKDYLPLLDPINRDLTVGNALLRLWYQGPRLETIINNRATIQLYVTPEEAAVSDGRVKEMNTTQTFQWGGIERGVVGGELGDAEDERQDSVRLAGLWTFGEDDSYLCHHGAQRLRAAPGLEQLAGRPLRGTFAASA